MDHFRDYCCGFYDGVRGVLFLDTVDNDHRFVVDHHEGTHRWLAENTVLGTIYRFFALLRERAQGELSMQAKAQIDRVLQTLVQTSYLPQELTATYLSLCASSRFYPQQFPANLQALAKPYKEMLELAISAFGPIESGLSEEEKNHLVAIVRHLAQAALSPPTQAVPSKLDLRDLTEVIQFVETQSANQRFSQILREAKPSGLLSDSMKFATLHWQSIWEEANAVQASGMEYYSLATFVFDRVEAVCPNIQVAKQRSQIEAWAHAFFETLRSALRDEGSTVLDQIQLVDPSPEVDWVANYMSQELSMAGPFGVPIPFFDTALTHLIRDFAQLELITDLINLSRTSDLALHAFIAPVSPSDSVAIELGVSAEACLLFGDVWHSPVDIPSFFIVLSLDQLRNMTEQMTRHSLVLRSSVGHYSDSLRLLLTDYRMHRHIYISVPNSAPESLVQFLQSQPSSYFFALTINHPFSPTFGIQFVKSRGEVFIAAMTPIRFNMVADRMSKSREHVIINELEEITNSGIDMEELRSVLTVISLALIDMK